MATTVSGWAQCFQLRHARCLLYVGFHLWLDNDKEVHEFQMGFGFQLRIQHTLLWYDFAEAIVQEMLNQFKEYHM